jgi:hypothetical protein
MTEGKPTKRRKSLTTEQRERYNDRRRRNREKLKGDPVAYAEHLKRKKEYDAKYYSELKQDTEAHEASLHKRRQYYHDVIKKDPEKYAKHLGRSCVAYASYLARKAAKAKAELESNNQE